MANLFTLICDEDTLAESLRHIVEQREMATVKVDGLNPLMDYMYSSGVEWGYIS